MPGFEQVVHALDEEKTVQEGTQAEKVEKSGKKDTEELNRKEAQLFAQRAKLEEFVAAHKGELSNKGKIQELMKDFLQDMDNGLDYAKTELQQEDKTDELMALNKDYGSALQSFEALLTRTNTEFANVESETRKSYLSLKSEILKEHNLEVAAKSSEQGNESLEQTNLDYLQKLDLTDTEAISDIFESSESRVYYDALFAVIEDTQDQYGQYSQKASDIIQRYAQ